MRNYSQMKRAKHDFCNICGKKDDLTWDHVPPKGCLNSFPVKFNRILENIPKYNDYNSSSQNGIRFRSLCSHCNNFLLGAEYDPALIEFTTKIVEHIRKADENTNLEGGSGVLLTPMSVEVQINRLSRAVCGHFLAAKNMYDDGNILDNDLREYFLDPNAIPPETLNLFAWFYPYSTIVIVRDFLAAMILNRQAYPVPQGMCNIISSFPNSFVLCEKGYKGNLTDIFSYCSSDINEKVSISIDFSSCFLDANQLRHPQWPCFVSDNPDGVDIIFTTENTTNSSVFGIRNIKLKDV